MNPRHATRFAQGKAAAEAGDLAGAERAFLAVVEEDGKAHEAWLALAVIALRRAAPQLAVERASRAVELDRKNAVYLNNLGIAYAELGELGAAERALRRALKLKPDYAGAHFNLAKALHKQGKLAEAGKEYERAHALEPGALAARLGLSRILLAHGEPGRALTVLRAAGPCAELAPAIGQCLIDAEGVEAALAFLREQAGNPYARLSLADLLLSLGRWREAWRCYLGRSHDTVLPARLEGARIVLRPEQGIGDVLFFLRFAPALQARGAAICLDCPPKLAPLLSGRIALDHDSAAGLEMRLGDLPALLETEATPPAFPLQAEESARERLAAFGPGPYLGLTWRAGVDRSRTSEYAADFALLSKEIAPTLLGEAVRGWRGTLVSLQRSPAPQELQALRAATGAPVHDLASVNEDLREALAVLAQLDEYVAVSNTNVHLLAGLGRRGRVLVPYPPEWRWMREGESPWFPGFPIYRQSPRRSWDEALARLRADLFTSPPRAGS